jgi:hypothetical protein
MVDQESRIYRPRRAFIESDVQSPPDMPATSHRQNGRPIAPRVVDEDHPKPLYRDEAWTNGGSSPASRAAPIHELDPRTDETLAPITFTPRHTGIDDETTTILPRSRGGKRPTRAPLDAIDDYDDDEPKRLSQRAKLALLIGAVAAVAVIGLLVGYAVLATDNQPQSPPSVPPNTSGSGTTDNAGQGQGQTGAALLTDATMLSPDQAKVIDRDRTWKVTSTEQNPSEDAPAAACFGGEPLVGQLAPQQKILRVLESGGKKAPAALHEATAYGSVDDATQAYMIASKALGGCAVTGSYIESGRAISGVGNQSTGVVVIDVSKSRAHSVILNRTGRVVNVIDAFQPSKALAMSDVANALGQVNSVQCGPAGGECSGTARVKNGPPPMGGDEPGALATGDLPPTRAKIGAWVPTESAQPKAQFKGSGCEKVDWATVPAKSKSWRVYLYPESGKNFLGLDEIVLTTKDAKAASKLVDQIRSDLAGCKSRKLTASVSKPAKVTGIGADKTKIAGWTTAVSQKSTDGTAEYRVGIVAAGSKVIYTFLNPNNDYDMTRRQWDTVAVRAGERATQVR